MVLEIKVLDFGDIELESSFLVLGRGCGRTKRVPVYGFLILGGRYPIVVDTGYRDNAIMETLGMRGLQHHENMIENQLARHGVKVGDVRFVCHTHAHIDHAVDGNALIAGTWGAEPVPGLEAQPGDHIIRKTRMSAWEGTNLETILRAEGRDVIIETGAWTNMSVEHTARTGADKGYVMIIPEDGCSTMNADWHRASIEYAMTNVALVTKVDAVIAALR